MKKTLPIITNTILTIIYLYCTIAFLENLLGYDYLMYIDGREEYRFGIGWTSVCFILILFTISIIWTSKNKNLFKTKAGYAIYLFLVTCIDGFWLLHYIDYYLYPILNVLADIYYFIFHA